MKYAVIIEKGTNSFGAYVPDLPGCVAVGETENETIELIKEAIEFHLESFKLNKKRLPKAKSKSMEFEFS